MKQLRITTARRRLGVLTALLALAGLVLGAPTPAQAARTADGIVTLSTRPNTTVGADTCGNAASYRLNVDLRRISQRYDAEDLDWTADVTITGPGGFFTTDFVWDDTSWQGVFVCEFPSRAGTYTVRADVTVDGWTYDSYYGGYYDYSPNLYQRTLRQAVVLKARSTVTATKRVYGAHRWHTTASLRIAGKPKADKVVKLQRRASSSWVTVATRRTGGQGKATAVLKGRPGTFRWYFPGHATAKSDSSPTFRLPRR